MIKKILKYTDKVPYKQRCEESLKIRYKYPYSVPVIVDVMNNDLKLYKFKFLVQRDLCVSYLIYKIRSQLVLESYKGIFIFCDKILLNNTQIIGSLYEDYLTKNNIESDGDQYLYLSLYSENVFG
jgi:hypothetical protein